MHELRRPLAIKTVLRFMRAYLAIVTMVFLASPAVAQIHVGLGGGVVFSSPLVRDSLGVESITVVPDPAPFITLGFESQVQSRLRAGVAVRISRSELHSENRQALGGDPAQTRTSKTLITRLTIWSPVLTLRREITSRASAWATVGAIFYDPRERGASIFQGDTPKEPTLGLGLSLEQPVSSSVKIGLDVSYSAHRFTTRALRINGFRDERTIHRLSLAITVRDKYDAKGG